MTDKGYVAGPDGEELRLLANDVERAMLVFHGRPQLSLHRGIWTLAIRSMRDVARWLDGLEKRP